MATIELIGITHTYPGAAKPALEHFDMRWDDGSANALLGPSGCGKTTVLNLISGLLVPDHGRVLVDGQDVTRRPARQRGIAQVFQFPVVYDGLSVFGNLAFPLKNAGVPRAERTRRVEAVAELLDLTPLLKRSASRLSQAEKQKVSLGRGLVRTDTAAILLDEPLTVIDPKEKYLLRRKLKEIQRQLCITMIYVTHDQHEALTFADAVTVMNDGRIAQVGTPEELHHEPASPFVGFFIGTPGMNLFDGAWQEGRLRIGAHGLNLSAKLGQRVAAAGPVQVGIRPEHVTLAAEPAPTALPCTVAAIEDLGTHRILTLNGPGLRLKSREVAGGRAAVDDQVWATFPELHLRIYRDGKRLH